LSSNKKDKPKKPKVEDENTKEMKFFQKTVRHLIEGPSIDRYNKFKDLLNTDANFKIFLSNKNLITAIYLIIMSLCSVYCA